MKACANCYGTGRDVRGDRCPCCSENPAAEIAALRAEVERLKAATVPAGWQMVPVEPTLDMLRAMQSSGWMPANYNAMLAAAPTPPQSADAEDDAEAAQFSADSVAAAKAEAAEFSQFLISTEADAEAVPVAEVSGSVPPTRSAMVFPLGDVCLLQGMKLYDRPQPADVGVLVEALREIESMPMTPTIAQSIFDASKVARAAIAKYEAKR